MPLMIKLVIVDAQFAQFADGPLGFLDGNCFRVQDEDERCLRGIAHGRQGAFVLMLGILNGRRRADAGLPAARTGCIDGLAPLGRQLQQAQGVAGGRRVEDDTSKAVSFSLPVPENR